MKGKIFISLDRRFSQSIYAELRERGFVYIREYGWLIPINRVEEFEKIAGLAIPIDEGDLLKIESLVREVKEAEISVGEKGESRGEMEIAHDEAIYKVTLPSGMSYTVPVSIVQAYKDVIEELGKRGVSKLKKKELVEMVLRRIGFTKFFSRDGSYFYWETFYGDRTTYHTHYYIPAKILESMGLISLTKQDEVVIRSVSSRS